MKRILHSIICSLLIFVFTPGISQITHGPILGRPSESGIGIWIRTSVPGEVIIRYGLLQSSHENHITIVTRLENDCSGWGIIDNLESNKKYWYKAESGSSSISGSFKTLPSNKEFYDEQFNKDSLFNFSFHFGDCANQRFHDFSKGDMKTFGILNANWKDKVDFSIWNGDFIYEDARETSVKEWQIQTKTADNNIPDIVKTAPAIVGVWQNYKNYLDRSANLRNWLKEVPTLFIMDDHEVVGDFYGPGEIGRRDKKALFRDIGTRAYLDYIGWSNPFETKQDIVVGKCQLKKGDPILRDKNSDFSKINLDEVSNIHVHWGEKKGGSQDAGVYQIKEIVNKNTLKIDPLPVADETSSYSIGRQMYYRKTIGNCDFFFLDTRSNRGMHDTKNPKKEGLSMLGNLQYEWLIDGVKKSNADFIFIVSGVSFMVPHTGTHGYNEVPNKDDSWTSFLWERDRLLDFFESINKKVFLLTGDVHEAWSIKVTDNMWEFNSGPLNSRNHPASNLENVPPNGKIDFNGRPFTIKWSTWFAPDTKSDLLHCPVICIIKVNNLFSNPLNENSVRWIKFPVPQVIFQFYSGNTGELMYAESVSK